MRVSNVHRFVFVNSPRAGSHSLHNLIDTHWGGFTISDEHHEVYATCPEEYRDYFSWTVVRDPYERMISVWHKDQQHKRPALSLSGFVREWIEHAEMAREDVLRSPYRYALPQLERAAGVDLVLRLEDLPLAFQRLPWVGEKKGAEENPADLLPVLRKLNPIGGVRIRADELSPAVKMLIRHYEGFDSAIWEHYEK